MKKLFWVAALIWLLANIFTLTSYPAVWVDEILSADAGIHLAQGKGFVSAGWFNQPSWEFWASYPPLYAFLLAGWLKVFGISAFAVRSFGLSVVTVSLLMVGLFLKRLGNDSARWTIVAALAVCEPVAFLERAGRPDSVSVFLLCATSLGFMSREWRRRDSCIFVLGALAVPAALQYAACVLLLGALIQIWFQPFTRREITLWGSGALCGTAFLAALYAAHGVLRIFIESTIASKHSSAGRLMQNLILKNGATPFVLTDIVAAPFRDYATPVLILAGAIAWILARRSKNATARQLSSLGVACALIIPLAIQLLGKYPIYYAYMATLPATVAVMAAYGRLGGATARFANVAILTLLFVGGTGRFWVQAPDHRQTVLANTDFPSSGDTVVADYPVYYQLLGHVRELFAVGYAGGKVMPHFPQEQANRVTKLIVRDSLFTEVTKKLGGSWQRTNNVWVERHGEGFDTVFIDDDTRGSKLERVGIYVRVPTGGNKNFNASGAR